MTTPVAQITATGISAPSYADVLAWYQAQYRSIYGSDVVLDADTQDGQWVAIQAAALNDANAMAVAVYNARGPATAQGGGLSSIVKINGLLRHVPSSSTATVTIVGQAFTLIENGKVKDSAGNAWSLPNSVVIPVGGSIDVTATCDVAGAITAGIGAIAQIFTPTLGWQSVTNAAAATVGAPVESDAALRQRQAISTALPAQTPLQAIVAAVQGLSGVTLVKPYENNTSSTDANGIPAWSIALVVQGGVNGAIASAILNKKIPGGPTFGSTTVSALDPYGVAKPISFSRPSLVQIQAQVTIHPLAGYTSVIGDNILQAVVDYINGLDPSLASSRTYSPDVVKLLTGLGIGTSVYRGRLYLPANLFGGAGAGTYEVTGLQICVVGGSLGTADIAIAFNQLAQAQLTNVSLVTA
ncbi:MAG: hypothetical protein JWQ97_301 [Phenylobacterium sp.]|nr:hypothetical protein [Phenylobacterium sp.]